MPEPHASIPSVDRLADGLTDDVVALPSPVRVLLVEDDRDYAEFIEEREYVKL